MISVSRWSLPSCQSRWLLAATATLFACFSTISFASRLLCYKSGPETDRGWMSSISFVSSWAFNISSVVLFWNAEEPWAKKCADLKLARLTRSVPFISWGSSVYSEEKKAFTSYKPGNIHTTTFKWWINISQSLLCCTPGLQRAFTKQ